MVFPAQQAENRLAAGDLGPELGVGGKGVPLEIHAGDLELGAFEDLKNDLHVADVPPLDQLHLRKLIAFFLVQPLDLSQGQPGLGGIGAVADLEVGVLFDLLEGHSFPPPELDDLEHGHFANPEDQDILAALGRRFLIIGLDVGEPPGTDQALDIRLDLLLVERLTGPAEELRQPSRWESKHFPRSAIP